MTTSVISEHLDKVLASKGSVYLLDLSWLMHRGFYSKRGMGVEDESGAFVPTGHIQSVLSCVMTLRRAHRNSTVVICQDGRPTRRREIYPDYKAGRSKPEYDLYADIPLIKEASFVIPGVYWAYNDDRESDDLMFALARQIHALAPGLPVHIHTGDNDLLQAIDSSTFVFRELGMTGSVKSITESTLASDENLVKKFKGTSPSKMPIFRALTGDASDGIKGIKRMPKALAHRLAEEADSIDDIFSATPTKDSEQKWLDRIREDEARIRTNHALMALSPDIEVNLSRRRPDVRAVMEAMGRLRMTRYLEFVHLLGY